MPNNVKTVTLAPAQDGVTWHNVPPVKLPPNTGEYWVKFQITGSNTVTFNENEPIWVRSGTKPDVVNKSEVQLPAACMKVSADGKELTVLDLNNNNTAQPVQLHYRLNFKNYKELDPIIENGGGAKPFTGGRPGVLASQYDFTTVAIVAVVALILGMIAHWGYRKLT